jgi:hypothetical protein
LNKKRKEWVDSIVQVVSCLSQKTVPELCKNYYYPSSKNIMVRRESDSLTVELARAGSTTSIISRNR